MKDSSLLFGAKLFKETLLEMQQMTELTEENLENISKALDIPKEQVLGMTEKEIVNAFETMCQKVELDIQSKTEEIVFLRQRNIKLQIESAFLRLGCVLRQIQIGFTFMLKDLERILKIK